MLKHLNDLLFTNPPIKEEDPSFIYQHSSKNKDANYGQFWNGNYFAAYGLVDPVYHYFIPQGKGESNLYTSETALFYNRGHVYEWFLADINKNPNMQRTPQPVPFMKRHSKDNVAFLKAGDYTRKAKSKDGSYTIQAVQVKKQNNTKLISYYQLKSTLETLLGLTGTVSKEKYKQIVKEAFVAKQRNLSRGASTKVDQVVDNLFQKLQGVQMK